MDSQDIAKIGHRAKRETEAFLNHYINDRAKGWPLLSRCGSTRAGYHRQQHIKRPGISQFLRTG